MTSDKLQQVLESLHDKEYRDAFVSSSVDLGVAFQIRALREARGWNQSQLGKQTSMKQERISQLEDRNYGRPSITTLKRLASAFDTAVIVKFARFTELVNWMVNLTPERLAPPSFEEEQLEQKTLIMTASDISGTDLGEITMHWERQNPTDASYPGTGPVAGQEPQGDREKARQFAMAAA